jgi:CBS domain containing-hemolysin-like protein
MFMIEKVAIFSSHFVSIVLAFVLVTYFHLVLGEQVPKIIAVYNPERVIILSSFFLEVFNYLFFPMTYLVKISQNKIASFFGVNVKEHKEVSFSLEEMKEIIKNLRDSNLLREDVFSMVSSILDLSKYKAKDVMVHRTDVIYLNYNDRIENIIDVIVNNLHSRYPVYKDNLDNIVGILHVKDIFLAIRKKVFLVGEVLKILNRKVLYVPESSDLFNTLDQMKKDRVLMAIVVDEYGGNKGIITFDDIISKVLGNILDEFDLDKVKVIESVDGYIISADTYVYELPKILRDIFDNSNSLVISFIYDVVKGRIPKKGEIIKYKDYKIKILETKGNAVKYIKIFK